MLSPSFASLPLLQPLWSCYCTVVASSFSFLPKDCRNFLLTRTGSTTAAPARGSTNKFLLLLQGHLNTSVWCLPARWFPGSSRLRWWSQDDPTRLGYLCSTHSWACASGAAAWHLSPFGKQSPVLCAAVWLHPFPGTTEMPGLFRPRLVRLSVDCTGILSSCSEVQILSRALRPPLNSSPNG